MKQRAAAVKVDESKMKARAVFTSKAKEAAKKKVVLAKKINERDVKKDKADKENFAKRVKTNAQAIAAKRVAARKLARSAGKAAAKVDLTRPNKMRERTLKKKAKAKKKMRVDAAKAAAAIAAAKLTKRREVKIRKGVKIERKAQ